MAISYYRILRFPPLLQNYNPRPPYSFFNPPPLCQKITKTPSLKSILHLQIFNGLPHRAEPLKEFFNPVTGREQEGKSY